MAMVPAHFEMLLGRRTMYQKKVLTTLAVAATVGMLLSSCANQAGTGGSRGHRVGCQQGQHPGIDQDRHPGRTRCCPRATARPPARPALTIGLRRCRDRPQRPAGHQHLQRHPAGDQPAQQGQPRLPGRSSRSSTPKATRTRPPARSPRPSTRRTSSASSACRSRASPRPPATSSSSRAWSTSPRRPPTRPDPERLDDLLPRPGQRRRAGPGGGEVPDRQAAGQEGLPGPGRLRLRHRPRHHHLRRRSAARWSAPTR